MKQINLPFYIDVLKIVLYHPQIEQYRSLIKLFQVYCLLVNQGKYLLSVNTCYQYKT